MGAVWRRMLAMVISIPLATLASLIFTANVRAQSRITPDNSLGAERSVVTPNVVIKGLPSERIDGGATRGANLFHSFQEFNVDAGRGAYFSNPAGIQNILSRVTGSNVSNIFGKLGVLGNANLFFINPNGIIFGPNASLDLNGSFFASTANSIVFPNGFEFSATNPQAPPLLTVNIPIGLRFRDNPGSITNQSVLQVPSGNTLALVGGDVSLNGGGLIAAGGRVELGGLTAGGTVGLQVNSNNLAISFPDGVTRGDVLLTNGSTVNVRSGGGGSIAINAQNLNLSGSSNLRAGIASGLGSINSKSGDIDINATKTVTLADLSLVSNALIPGAIGSSGNVNVTTESLLLTGGSQLSASTFGLGNAGNVNINASNITFTGVGNTLVVQPGTTGTFRSSGVLSTVEAEAMGNGGIININANSLSLSDGAQIQTLVRPATGILPGGRGNAGNININIRDAFTITGVSKEGFTSAILANVEAGAMGNGGNVNINAGSLSLTNGAQISASTFGKGNAGNVIIQASTISFDGGRANFRSGIFNNVESTGNGQAGEISIKTGSLSLTNGAQLAAATFGQGNAGKVIIQASTISFDGGRANFRSGIFNNVESTGNGQAGEISIKTESLSLTNGAQIATGTFGEGNAGKITIEANGTISFNGGNEGFYSGIYSTVEPKGKGEGGNVSITTKSFSLTNGGLVTVNNQGTGSAGSIEVTARSIQLDNQGQITAQTTSGNGGNITLTTQDLLLLRNGSLISTNAGTTSSGGNGGNITITAPVIVAFPSNNDITANAFSGTGGNVKITTSGLFGIAPLSRAELARRLNVTDSSQTNPSLLNPSRLPTSDITAISQQNPSLSGTITINSPDVDPSRGLIELPVNVVDPTTLIAQTPCHRSIGSEFTITGRGGLPPNPNQILASDNVRVDLVKPASSTSNSPTTSVKLQSLTPTVKRLVPAEGWIFNDKGQVVLTAYDPTKTGPQRSWQEPASCANR